MKPKTSLITSIVLFAIPWLIYLICFLALRSTTGYNGISPDNVLTAVFMVCRFVSIFPFVLLVSSIVKFIPELKNFFKNKIKSKEKQ